MLFIKDTLHSLAVGSVSRHDGKEELFIEISRQARNDRNYSARERGLRLPERSALARSRTVLFGLYRIIKDDFREISRQARNDDNTYRSRCAEGCVVLVTLSGARQRAVERVSVDYTALYYTV